MKKIIIEIIPHESQAYETVGNYWLDEFGNLQVRVSDMQNEDYHVLVAIHEVIEAYLAKKRGIRFPEIDLFDMKFEQERKEGKHTIDAEPGDDLRAPYRREHRFATTIELVLAVELDIDWKEYSETVEGL